MVHRHIGGLEDFKRLIFSLVGVHRHIGGLEDNELYCRR